jgi:hypothetical protein
VRTQNHDPDTIGRGCRGKEERGAEAQRNTEEKRNESGGGKEGAMEAAVGEGRGKSIEDTTGGSKSEHHDGFKLKAREEDRSPLGKGFMAYNEWLEVNTVR